MQDGMVKTIYKDYLSKAVIIEHEHSGSSAGRLLSFCAHTDPRSEIEVGVIVKEGDIIATLADTTNSKSNNEFPGRNFTPAFTNNLNQCRGILINGF